MPIQRSVRLLRQSRDQRSVSSKISLISPVECFEQANSFKCRPLTCIVYIICCRCREKPRENELCDCEGLEVKKKDLHNLRDFKCGLTRYGGIAQPQTDQRHIRTIHIWGHKAAIITKQVKTLIHQLICLQRVAPLHKLHQTRPHDIQSNGRANTRVALNMG